MEEEPHGISPEMRKKIRDLLDEGDIGWLGTPPDFSLDKEEMTARVKEPEFIKVDLEVKDGSLGFRWQAKSIGFGCVDIYKDKTGNWVMDSETMSNEFVCKMFLHFIKETTDDG